MMPRSLRGSHPNRKRNTEMNTDTNTTVQQHAENAMSQAVDVPFGYDHLVSEAAEGVAAWVTEAVESVIQQATSRYDVDEDDVRQFFYDAGLLDPEPEPEPEPETETEAAPSWARDLISTVNSLAGFARRHGFSG